MRFFPTIFSRIYRLGAPPPLSPQQLWGTSKSKFFAGLFYSDPAAALIKPFAAPTCEKTSRSSTLLNMNDLKPL
jgi:hypothetical protein